MEATIADPLCTDMLSTVSFDQRVVESRQWHACWSWKALWPCMLRTGVHALTVQDQGIAVEL